MSGADGYVWYQTYNPDNTVGSYVNIPPRVQSSGYVPLVATNAEDKWVVADPKRSRILVITSSGDVWAHLGHRLHRGADTAHDGRAGRIAP